MEVREKYRPFTGDSDTSVRLGIEPLVLVLCQVRWPSLTPLDSEEKLREAASRFGEAMDGYPLVSQAKSINYVITPEGVTASETGSVHQWGTVDGAWHVSLSNNYVSLYSTQYEGYDDLKTRLSAVLESLRDVLKLPLVDRVGMRYVNRLSAEQDIKNLRSLVRPEVLGLRALDSSHLLNSTNLATYNVDGALLQVRSGMLAPDQTVDPVIASVPGESWVLDLDASQEVRQSLDVDEVAKLASRMSDIAYDYFKSIATESFISRFAPREQDCDNA